MVKTKKKYFVFNDYFAFGSVQAHLKLSKNTYFPKINSFP